MTRKTALPVDLSKPVYVGFIDNDDRVIERVDEIDRFLRDHPAHLGFPVRLEACKSPIEIKERWDAVIVDLSLDDRDEAAMTDWVLGWDANPASAKILPPALSGLQLLSQAVHNKRIAACFTKAGFEAVAAVLNRKGILYYPKPRALTTNTVKGATRADLEKLLENSRDALIEDWLDIRPAIETLIRHLSHNVVKDRLSAFWPLDLHAALSHTAPFDGHEVPNHSYAFLFDLAHSSLVSGGQKPQQYWRTLNDLLASLYQIAEKTGGWIESFLGDGALVQFNTFAKIAGRVGSESHPSAILDDQVKPFLGRLPPLKSKLPTGTELRVLGTYLDPGSSMVGTLGGCRFHIATISDQINTCAHIMKRVLDEDKDARAFFGASLIRIGFFCPKGFPTCDEIERVLKPDWEILTLPKDRTDEYLKSEPANRGQFYLLKLRSIE